MLHYTQYTFTYRTLQVCTEPGCSVTLGRSRLAGISCSTGSVRGDDEDVCCRWRVSTMNVVVFMLLMLTGSRAAPTSGPPHFFSRARRNNPTDMLNSFRLPDNFTISGPCLATILSGLCNGFYFHTTTTNYGKCVCVCLLTCFFV